MFYPLPGEDEQELIMSKYIYTTIYEQFTGLKPPEPKDQKPRRRRGYGHPYRMRLNMQENSSQAGDARSSVDAEQDVFDHSPVSVFQPSVKKQSVHRFTSGNQTYHGGNSTIVGGLPSMHEARHAGAEPKVTYKRRRHFGPSSYGSGSIDASDIVDNTDY